MRRFTALVLASSIAASSAWAADVAPLAPGKPAGIQQATLAGNGLLLFFGLAIVGGGIALVATQGSGNHIATSTSTTSTP